jgi:hypothetical protein
MFEDSFHLVPHRVVESIQLVWPVDFHMCNVLGRHREVEELEARYCTRLHVEHPYRWGSLTIVPFVVLWPRRIGVVVCQEGEEEGTLPNDMKY